ncbi:MAG TPA: hypothetical protein VIE63_08670 [Ramlibacter sp.]|jgi:hypothetical protein
MRIVIIAAALVGAIALGGCRHAPLQQVEQQPVVAANGKTLSHDQVHAAILRAGAALGWQMVDEGPDKIVATLHLREHTAVVEIPYSTTTYSIKYRSSVNLDESNGQIHKNYNGWVQNLTKGINTQLGLS